MTREEAIGALMMCHDLMLFDPMTGETSDIRLENKDNQDLYYACEMAISALSAEPKWISVKERPPETETNVLIMQKYSETDCFANITIGHLHQPNGLRRKPYWNWIGYGQDMVHPKIEAFHRADFICPGNEFVTHWMPLPEKPKEETKRTNL